MWWTAQRASEHLGVKRKTLYTYVSRGWVRSRSLGGRECAYLAEDVQELARRASEARGRSAAAGAAMRWGPPVLSTQLSAVDPDGPYYRGRSALGFSEAGTPLEDVAAHLWGRPLRPLPVRGVPSGAAPQRLADALCAVLLLDPPDDEEAALAAVLRGVAWHRWRPAGEGRAAERLALALGVGPEVPLDEVLALCVDHELNASTFAARVAAGTGAELGLCLRAALCAWSGPRHGMAMGTVTDGGVSFGFSGAFATSSGDTVDADFTGAAAGEQLFESW